MFKSVRWRSEKNKINALFKLSFHATQVLQLSGSTFVLSLVPTDTGKPTAKLEKYEIRDDCCYWESPIFETVKFVQDPKNGKIHDRIYRLILSTGSSKSTIVGEASVNFSDYAEATKATSVALPFKSSKSDAVLHVSIQRITENVNPSDLEEHEVKKTKSEDRSLKRHFGKGDSEENTNTNFNEENPLMKTVANNMPELNGNGRASIGSDITLSGSENSSGLDTLQELGMKSNDVLMDINDSSTDGSTISQRDILDENVERLKSDVILLSRKADIADLELQTLRKQIVKEGKRGQDLLKEVACLKNERDAFQAECERLKASQKARSKVNYEGDPWDLLEETRQELNHEKDLNANLRLQLHKTQESNAELILAIQDLEQLLEQTNRGDLDSSVKPVSDNISEKLEGSGQEGHGQNSDDDEQKALEELVKQHIDAKEAYILEQKIMDLCTEIEMYRRDKDDLEMQMEQLALDYEILKQENHNISYQLDQSDIQHQLKLQYECSGSYAIIHELESQVEKLERELDNCSDELSESLAIIKDLENQNHTLEEELEKQAQQFKAELEAVGCAKMEQEQQAIQAEEALRLTKHELKIQIETLESELKKPSKELSEALATIKELEDHIENLEEELDKQAQGFESDLEAITRAKVEQEQRAIRAEENIRLIQRKNTTTADRLQDEFKRLSMQMQSTFEANEKVATKAMTEANQLRLVNNHLEDLLQQARNELELVKEDYEAQVSDLRNQLEAQREHENEACQSLTSELLMIRAEVDRLTLDTACLRAQITRGEELKAKLQSVVDSTKKDAEESLVKLKDEKDTALRNLQTELDTLRTQCEELRQSLFEADLEKEKFEKQVFQLQDELKKKDDALINMERKLKDNNNNNVRTIAAERTKASSKNSKTEVASRGSKDAASLKERLKLLEGQIQQKDIAMETSANAFLEKETDLHNKIEELERRLEELKQNNEDDRKKEIASLREDNSFMEAELKEMQQRYSEISLKFAEVEGERQRLVMTLRNVKNTKKS